MPIKIKISPKMIYDRRIKKLLVLFFIFFFWACTQNRFPELVIAEEDMVADCMYMDTISETSDPGKFMADFNKYRKYYEGELKVLERASYLGATHVVWVYNYPIGSSASAFWCESE